MFFESLNTFFRKHTVICDTRWFALALIAVGTAAVLSGCTPHPH